MDKCASPHPPNVSHGRSYWTERMLLECLKVTHFPPLTMITNCILHSLQNKEYPEIQISLILSVLKILLSRCLYKGYNVRLSGQIMNSYIST